MSSKCESLDDDLRGSERAEAKRRGLKEVLGVFFVRGLGALSMFLLYAVVARQLPIDQAGLLYVGLGALAMLMPISVVGLNHISLRMIGARSLTEQADEIRFVAVRTRWWAFLSSTGIAIVFFALSVPLASYVFRKPELAGVFRWIAPGILFGGLATVLAGQLQGIRRFSAALIVLSIVTPLSSAMVISAFPNADAEVAAVALLIGTIAAFLVGIGLLVSLL